MSFQIKYKDAMGRIGLLETPHGKIKTPALMPVIHPKKQILDSGDMGAEVVMTNAYTIHKDEDLKIKALRDGVHELINFHGPIFTDSGSFQLSEYGEVKITNREIVEFQEKIKSDVGTSLDIPTPPYVSWNKAQRELDITIKRAEEALKIRENLMLNSVVQGSTYTDLRARCALKIGGMDFQVYSIGAVVPLLESYKFRDLLKVLMTSIKYLPDSKPRHLMGAGHPMIFALAVALGCDLFDSAAYILYAQDDRVMIPTGTSKLENLYEMPCSCNICNSYTPDELRDLGKEERTKLLAQHNLHVSFAEIKSIKQALRKGSLFELVEQRCRAHPNLLDALRNLKKYKFILEEYDPAYKKSAFFYSGPESLNRPEILRHLKRLERLPPRKKVLLLPSSKKPYSNHLPFKQLNHGKYLPGESLVDMGNFYHQIKIQNSDRDESDEIQAVIVDIPFGIIPLEIEEVYPLSQNEAPLSYDEDAKKFLQGVMKHYTKNFNEVIVSEEVVKTFDLDFTFPYPNLNKLKIYIADKEKIKNIADYQFGGGAGEALFELDHEDLQIIKSKKTKKIRHIYGGEDLIATLRASDGVFVLGMEGAKRLHAYLEYPKNRVVVKREAEPFAREGKSIFAKFVIDCDIDIRANEEVLIVNEEDNLLAYGKSLLNGKEILDFDIGQAIKTRKGG